MSLPFILGVGSLEIEERRPRSANEPRVKRLSFAKNRRHVTDDRYRGRRGFSDEWAMVPYDVGQRRQNQIEEFDRKKAAAQLRFDDQEYRRQHQLNTLQLQYDEERHRRRILEARHLNDIILQGQQIPPHYWHRMQEMQRDQEMQRRVMHVPGPGEHARIGPPPPPEHGHHGGGGGHGDIDRRIVPIGPGGGDGGANEELSDEDRSDESEDECHPGDRGRSRSRSRGSRRGHPGHGGRPGHGEQENDIEVVYSDAEASHSRRRIGGGHGQCLPREFRQRPRSRSRAHRGHSRPRNHSRMSSRRTPSRHRRIYYSDDSETESEYEHVRIIRPRSRGSLIRGRGQSRHHVDYSSDDSFAHYNPRARFRLSSKPRRSRSRY